MGRVPRRDHTDMTEGAQASRMSNLPRALLTSGERDAIRGDEDMDQNTRNSHLSRIRRKMVKMREDAELLRKHHNELSRDLEDAVCRKSIDERLEQMDERIEDLDSRLSRLESDGDDGS